MPTQLQKIVRTFVLPTLLLAFFFSGVNFDSHTAEARHACPAGSTPLHINQSKSNNGGDAAGCETPQQAVAKKAAADKAAATISWTDMDFWTSGAFLIYMTGILLSFAGWMLNGSVQYFVIDMGKYLGSTTSIGQSIVSSWILIRDIINLTFVFGLIYLAFMTIAKADTQKLKQGVAQIIVGALLINFSLFFAKAIIDIGNVSAVEIYSYMEVTAGINPSTGLNYGISGFFMQQLGLQSFFNPDDVLSAGNKDPKNLLSIGRQTGFGFSIMVSLVLLIASFVFFAGAILIAIRFVVLALLLILSPVAFVGAFMPKLNTEEWSQMWWQKLISNVMFAPAYFLLLYISMKAVNVSSLAQGATSASPGNILGFFEGAGDASSVGAILNFVMVIGFLVGSLIIAKKMGAVGADAATAWGAKASFGLTAALGRNTFGRLGNTIAENKNLQGAANKDKGMGRFLARGVLNSSRLAQKSSFDARGLSSVQKLAKNRNVNLSLGTAQSGGIKGSLDAAALKDKEFADARGVIDDKDPMILALKQQQDDLKEKKEDAKLEFEKIKRDSKTVADDEIRKLQDTKNQEARKIEDQKKVILGGGATEANKKTQLDALNDKLALIESDTGAKVKTINDSHSAASKLAEVTHAHATHAIDETIEKVKENIEKEKGRYQTGGMLQEDEKADAIYSQYSARAKAIKKGDGHGTPGDLQLATRKLYAAKTKEEADVAAAEVAKWQEELSDIEKGQQKRVAELRKESGRSIGYAGELENKADDSHFGSGTFALAGALLHGRTRSMYKNSAEVIRGTKKIGKKEETKAKKDDHGGGHGGGH